MSLSGFPPPSLADALAHARQTRAVELASDVLPHVPGIFASQFGGAEAVVVADSTTYRLAGIVIAAAFSAAHRPLRSPHIFAAEGLYAEFSFVAQLEASLRQHAAIPIAVGSGTINDLVKLAAARAGRPYLCVPTAASMDGYTAFGASITFNGSKQTFECPAPVAVVGDLNILAAAPAAMTASGYADLLAKVTAGADWLVADAMGVETIHPEAWSIVQGTLREALSNPDEVRLGRTGAIRRLMEGLLMSGFAMQCAQSSRAASGAEHQFSHLWDMQHHTHRGIAPSHGFKVGVATVACAELYSYLLRQRIADLDDVRACAGWPEMSMVADFIRHAFPDTAIAVKAIEETGRKHAPPADLRKRLALLRQVWPDLRRQLSEQLPAPSELRAMLRAVGAPSEPEEIGISRARLQQSFALARVIRRRYTVLDLVNECGLFEPSLQFLFGSTGPWPIQEDASDSPVAAIAAL